MTDDTDGFSVVSEPKAQQPSAPARQDDTGGFSVVSEPRQGDLFAQKKAAPPPTQHVDFGGPDPDAAMGFAQDAGDDADAGSAGAAARSAGRGVLPGAAGMVGFGAGAQAGAAVAGVVAPFTGPAAPLVEAGGMLIGGGIGAYKASELAQRGQSFMFGHLPQNVQKTLGVDPQSVAADERDHPKATYGGELAAQLMFMRPGAAADRLLAPEATAFDRLMANPLTSHAVGATVGGVQEAASEEFNDGQLDPAKIGLAAGTGAILTHETRLGRGLALGGAIPVRAAQLFGAEGAARAKDLYQDLSRPKYGDEDTLNATRNPDGSYSVPTTPAGPPEAQAPIPLGFRQKAAVAPATLSPEDHDSPIDNSILLQGRAKINDALAGADANKVLTRNAWPGVGQPVTMTDAAGKEVHGVVADAFTAPHPITNGAADGIKIRLEDGRLFQAFAGELAHVGATIKPRVLPVEGSGEPPITPGESIEQRAIQDPDSMIGGGAEPARSAAIDTEKASNTGPLAAQEGGDGGVVDISAPPSPTTGDGTRTSPIDVSHPDHVDQAAGVVNTAPSEAQKEAGNYQKGHIRLQGMDIAIENPRGSTREGVGPDGTPWSVEMPAHYGYIKRTTGADDEQVDAYIGPNPASKQVFVVDQKDADTGAFDEHKVMLGYDSQLAAKAAYLKAFSDGKGAARIGGIHAMAMDDFKTALAAGKWDKPLAKTFTTTPGAIASEHAAEVSAAEAAGTADFEQKHAPEAPEAAPLAEATSVETEKPATQESTSQPEKTQAEPEKTGVTFTTAKGSTYEVHADGSTTRNKAARADVGHEGQQGPQPRSEKTFYVTKPHADELGLFQTQGGPRMAVMETGDGKIGVKYLDGKDAGKFERRTVSAVKTEPQKGLVPVETWKGGTRVHFGNEIADVEHPEQAPTREHVLRIDKKRSYPEARISVHRAPDGKFEGKFSYDVPGFAGGTGMTEPHETADLAELGIRKILADHADKIATDKGTAISQKQREIAGKIRDWAKPPVETEKEAPPAEVQDKTAATGDRPDLGPLWTFPKDDMAKLAILRATNEGRHFTLHDPIPTNARWLIAEKLGYANKKGVVRLTDKGNVLLADLNAKSENGDLPGQESLKNAAPAKQGKTVNAEEAPGPAVAESAPQTTKSAVEPPVEKAETAPPVKDAADADDRHAHDPREIAARELERAAARLRANGQAGAGTEPAEGDGGTGEIGEAGRDGNQSRTRDAGRGRSADGEGRGEGAGSRDRTGAVSDQREAAGRVGRDGNVPAFDGDGRQGDRAERGVRGQDFVAPEGFDKFLAGGSPKAKAVRNLRAIETLQAIEARGGYASSEEQQALAAFVGWGGLPQVFDDRNAAFASERGALRKLLTDEEWASAKASTINAHYTSAAVVKSMWEGLRDLGFTGNGAMLEPGMGIGNFIGMRPDDMVAPHFTGVELDSLTGRMARLLYPRAEIFIKGFEETALPASSFDAVIGNVPFADIKPFDKEYNPGRALNLHNYFINKSLNLLKPGGIAALVTSRYSLDSIDGHARLAFAKLADFLGAIRLPDSAFQENAGTQVVTDILFFRRRADGEAYSDATRDFAFTDKLDVDGTAHRVNKWIIDHPDAVLGEHSNTVTQYKKDAYNVTGKKGADMAKVLAAAIQSQIVEPAKANGLMFAAAGGGQAPPTESFAAPPSSVKDGAFFLDGDKLLLRSGERARAPDVKKLDLPRIKKMVGLRDLARQLLNEQMSAEDVDWEKTQKALNKAYDAFVAQHGFLNKVEITRRKMPETGEVREYRRYPNLAVFRSDPDVYLVASLERGDDEKGTFVKAAIMSDRVVQPAKVITHVDTAADALAASLNGGGRIDPDYMAKISGRTVDQVMAELKGSVFHDPVSGQWQTDAQYLSGNVRRALVAAKAAAQKDARYKENVTALEAVQPEDLPPSQIDVRLGAAWVPRADMESYISAIFGTRARVKYNIIDASWKVDLADRNAAGMAEWSTASTKADRILLDTLNQRASKVTWKDADGKEHTDLTATVAAQEMQQRLKDRFSQWVWEEGGRADRLSRLYNDTYNNSRTPVYDGSHLTLPNSSSTVMLRSTQKNAVWRALTAGNTLLDHTVGAGKTYTMVAIAQESKRMGLAHKPMLAVPNHMLEQFSREYLQLYPNANIIVADKDNFGGEERKRFVARTATGNWDAVIMPHSALELVPMSPKFQADFLESQVREYEEMLEGEQDRQTIKQIQKQIKRREEKVKALLGAKTKDKGVSFEEMGVDQMQVDELHLFKNLEFGTKMREISVPASQRAEDLYMKSRHIDRLTPGRNFIGATGTPIANSMAEMFTVQRYLGPRGLSDVGLQHFDAWAAQFGDTVTQAEIKPDGSGARLKTRFARFRNIPELIGMYRQFSDVVTKDDLKKYTNIKLPEIEGGLPHTVVVPGSDALRAYVADLAERAEAVRNRAVDPKYDNMLKISSDGRKAALDMRLVDPSAKADPERKAVAIANNVHDIWQAGAARKLTQAIFLDISTPKTDGTFNVYDDIRDLLLARGVPKDEIAYIHTADTDQKKGELFAALRDGRKRIILGSTEKMGVGTNIQRLLKHLHHGDAPWRPADLEQRNGRIERQGNLNDEIGISQYVTAGSFDAYMWQGIERKARFINAIKKGDPTVRNMDDIDEQALSYAEVKALASDNPLIMEKATVDAQVEKLIRLSYAHRDKQIAMRSQIAKAEGVSEGLTGKLAGLQKDAAQAVVTKGDAFAATIGGKPFKERTEAAKALWSIVTKAHLAAQEGKVLTPTDTAIGELGGFKVSVSAVYKSWPAIIVHQNRDQEIDVQMDAGGRGALQRIENQIANIPGKITETQEHLGEITAKLPILKAQIGLPFEKADALAAALGKQSEIDAKLMGTEAPKPAPQVEDEGPREEHEDTFDTFEEPEQDYTQQSQAIEPAGATGQHTDLTQDLGKFLAGRDGEAAALADGIVEYLQARGAQTSTEALVFYDGAAQAIGGASSQNARNSIKFTEQDLSRIQDPANQIVGVHNHPESRALSRQDLMALTFPGLRSVVSLGHNGNYYAASLTEKFRTALLAAPAMATRRFDFAMKHGDAALYDFLLKAVESGTLPEAVASQFHHAALVAGIERAGLIDYSSNESFPARYAEQFGAGVALAADTISTYADGFGIAREFGRENEQISDRPAGAVRPAAEIARIFAQSGQPGSGRSGSALGAAGDAAQPATPSQPGRPRLLEDEPPDYGGGGDKLPPIGYEGGDDKLPPGDRAFIDAHLAPPSAGLISRLLKTEAVREIQRDGFGNFLTRKLVNDLNPIFEYEKRATGGHIRDAQYSAAKMAEMTMSDHGRMWSLAHDGALQYNTETGVVEKVPGSKGLFDIFKYLSDPETYDLFRLYAAARRAQRLFVEDRERNMTPEAIARGMQLEGETGKYRDLLQKITFQNPETRTFKEIFDDYQDFNKALLQGMGVATDLLSPEQVALFTQHMDYVPFYREMEQTVGPPTTAFLKKNINAPDPKIKTLVGGKQRIADLMDNIVHNAMAITRAGMRNITMGRIHDIGTLLGEAEDVTEGGIEDGVLTYRVNGRDQKFTVSDPSLVAAVAAMRPEHHTGLYKALTAISGVLRNGITAAPAFMIRNLERGFAATFVQTGKNLSLQHNTLTGLKHALMSDTSIREMRAANGSGSYSFGGGGGGGGLALRRQIGAQKQLIGMRSLRKLWSGWNHLGEATELADRDALYMNLRKGGAGKAEAAYQAMNLINYSRRGASRSLRVLLPLIPFLNARIQGLYRMGETQSSGADKRNKLLGVLARGLLLTAVSLLLRQLFKGDPRHDDEPLNRRINYYIVYTQEGRVLIPKPFEFGALFSTLPELTLDAIDEHNPKLLTAGIEQTLLNTFSFNPIPQPALPLIETMANYDFFTGRPIEDQRLQNLPAGERANPGTSQTLKTLGHKTGISPAMMQEIVGGYTGTMGLMSLSVVDSLGRSAGLYPKEASTPFGGLPVVSDFLQSQLGSMYKTGPDPANRWVGEFYDTARDVQQLHAEFKALRHEGETDEAHDLRQDNPELASRHGLDRMERRLGKINSLIRKVEADDMLTGDEKRLRLDHLYQQRNDDAERTVKRIRAKAAAAAE